MIIGLDHDLSIDRRLSCLWNGAREVGQAAPDLYHVVRRYVWWPRFYCRTVFIIEDSSLNTFAGSNRKILTACFNDPGASYHGREELEAVMGHEVFDIRISSHCCCPCNAITLLSSMAGRMMLVGWGGSQARVIMITFGNGFRRNYHAYYLS